MARSFVKWGCCGFLLFVSVACQGRPSSPPAPVSPSAPVSDTSKKPETAPGGAPSPEGATTPSGDTAEIAGKWMEGMKSVLPSLFCKDGAYFRECFHISQQECEAEAIRVTRVCIDSKKDDLLKNFKAEDGKVWGEKVGECAGSSFEINLLKKKIDSPKCNDASQWM